MRIFRIPSKLKRAADTRTHHRIAALALIALTGRSEAQSTYDGDLTPRARWQAVVDASAYPESPADGGWFWTNPRIYRGVTKQLELGLGASLYSNAHGGTSAIQPSLKWRVWQDTVRLITLSAGGQGVLGMGKVADHYGFSFITLERALPSLHGSTGSASVGRYWLSGRDHRSSDTRSGVVATVWQALGPYRLSASWLAGHNQFGSRVVTMTYTTASAAYFGLGHFAGNASHHNVGPYLTVGRTY